ncbi:hypothetical protein, partial [Nostoc sp.]
LEDYLEYSEGQHDYLISDYLGCSYYFSSVEDYQDWVRDELLAKGKTLHSWRNEQQKILTQANKTHGNIRVLLRVCARRCQL